RYEIADVLRRRRKLEVRGHHPDDSSRVAVDENPSSDDLWIGTEPDAPGGVAEDENWSVTERELGRIEGASELRHEPDRAEEVTVDAQPAYWARHVASAQLHLLRRKLGDGRERAVVLTHEFVLKCAQRRDVVARLPLPSEVGEVSRLWDGEGSEKDRVDDAEDRRARANAEGHGENGCDGERRRATERPKRKLHVGGDVFHEPCALRLPRVFARRFRAAEGQLCLAQSGITRHSALHVPIRGHFEMKVHLAFHLAFQRIVAAQRAPDPQPPGSETHASTPLRMRSTPRESFSHCARSAASCFRPRRVTL